LHELTEGEVPCLKRAALYLAIFSFMDVDSSTRSCTDGPEAEEIITLHAFAVNADEIYGCISLKTAGNGSSV